MKPMKEKKNACTGCAAAEADGRFVRHPESADGEAVVTAYPVFPGIEIAYCDIHAHECRLEHTPGISLMRISHCRCGALLRCGEQILAHGGGKAHLRAGIGRAPPLGR